MAVLLQTGVYLMEKFYFGIIGKIFAGKETVFQIIKKLVEGSNDMRRVAIHHFSDPLNECLRAVSLPKERDFQQRLSSILRQEFGESVLGNALVKRALAEEAFIVCLDGIRRPQDTLFLRNLPNNYLISIETPVEVRFQRAQKRPDRPISTIDELLSQQSAEADSKIDEIGKEADFVLDNSGDLRYLEVQIQKILTGLNIKTEGGQI